MFYLDDLDVVIPQILEDREIPDHLYHPKKVSLASCNWEYSGSCKLTISTHMEMITHKIPTHFCNILIQYCTGLAEVSRENPGFLQIFKKKPNHNYTNYQVIKFHKLFTLFT